MTPGMEGTPWIAVLVQRASPRDRPFGWIVQTSTPGQATCHHYMTFAEMVDDLPRAVRAAAMVEVPVHRHRDLLDDGREAVVFVIEPER